MLRAIPDGTGMEMSTRGDWIRFKHQTKRGFIGVTILVDQDAMEILAYTATDERESKQFKRLMEDGLRNACVGTDARREHVKRAKFRRRSRRGRTEATTRARAFPSAQSWA